MSDVEDFVTCVNVRACGTTAVQVQLVGTDPARWNLVVPHEELRAVLARTGFGGDGPFEHRDLAVVVARRVASAYGDYLEARDAAFRVLEQELAREFPP